MFRIRKFSVSEQTDVDNIRERDTCFFTLKARVDRGTFEPFVGRSYKSVLREDETVKIGSESCKQKQ